jgi:hypothetical protein
LGDADLTNAVAGKPEAKIKLPDLTVNFSRGPFAHIPPIMAIPPVRNITIELLHPQGEMKKFYPSINEALSAATPDQRGTRQVGVLETDEMGVVAASVAANSSRSPAHDGRDRLVVMIGNVTTHRIRKRRTRPSRWLVGGCQQELELAQPCRPRNEAYGAGVQGHIRKAVQAAR